MAFSFALLLALAATLLPSVTAMRRSSKTVGMVMKGPPLCDAGIVQETCKSLNDGEESNAVSFDGLRDTLLATSASVLEFWDAVKFGKSSVPCLELYTSTVELLKDDLGVTVPDSSD